MKSRILGVFFVKFQVSTMKNNCFTYISLKIPERLHRTFTTFTESTEVCNFADDTTVFACDENLNSLIKRLEHDSLLAIEWFQNNNMKLNQDKCHLLVSGYKHENVWAQIGDENIWESNKQKLLGLQIDRNLHFNEYVSLLCKKAGKKTLSPCKIVTFYEH